MTRDTARTTAARMFAERFGDGHGQVLELDEEQRAWFGAVVIGMEMGDEDG